MRQTDSCRAQRQIEATHPAQYRQQLLKREWQSVSNTVTQQCFSLVSIRQTRMRGVLCGLPTSLWRRRRVVIPHDYFHPRTSVREGRTVSPLLRCPPRLRSSPSLLLLRSVNLLLKQYHLLCAKQLTSYEIFSAPTSFDKRTAPPLLRCVHLYFGAHIPCLSVTATQTEPTLFSQSNDFVVTHQRPCRTHAHDQVVCLSPFKRHDRHLNVKMHKMQRNAVTRGAKACECNR